MFRKKQNTGDPNVTSLTITNTQEVWPPRYEIVLGYKDGTTSEPKGASAVLIRDNYLHLVSKDQAKEIKQAARAEQRIKLPAPGKK